MVEIERGRPKKEIKLPDGDFELDCSLGPETTEVMDLVKEAEEKGKPIPPYELAQNMMYGKDFQPPPRIYFVYNDGRREVFKGDDFDIKNIANAEFTNSGPGLAPEELTIVRHGKGADTLGVWGRGLKYTLNYLAMMGMGVEVESNLNGNAWIAETSLKETISGLSETLFVRGKTLKGETSDRTVFRIKNPTESFLKQIRNLPNYFLFANPNYPLAAIVDRKNQDAKDEEQLKPKIDEDFFGGRVICLEGMVDWTKAQAETQEVYVDGLRLPKQQSYGQKFLFPWAFNGLRENANFFSVKRGKDSSSFIGNPEKVAQLVLGQCQDEVLLKKMLEAVINPPQHKYSKNNIVPAELEDMMNYDYAPEKFKNCPGGKTLEILKKLWDEKYGAVLISKNREEKEKLSSKIKNKEVIIVGGVVYHWLEKAGVRTIMQEIGVVNREIYSSNDMIKVDYANGDNYVRLKGLIDEAAESLGTADYEEIEGKKRIIIRYPYSICHKDDLTNRAKPGSQWLGAAAIIALKSKLNLDIVSHSSKQRAIIVPEAEYYYSLIGESECFKISFDIQCFDEEDPESSDHPNGITTIILAGEALQALVDPPSFLQDQVAAASEKARNLAAKKEELRQSGEALEKNRQKKIAEAEAELKRQQEAIAKLEEELKQFEEKEQEYQRKKTELETQRSKIADLENKINKAKHQRTLQIEEQVADLQDQVAAVSRVARNLEVRKEQLRSNSDQSEEYQLKKIAEAEAELKRQQEKIIKLEKELKQIEKNEQEYQRKKIELSEQEKRLGVLENKVNEARGSRGRKQKTQAVENIKNKNRSNEANFDPSRRNFLRKAGVLVAAGAGAYLAAKAGDLYFSTNDIEIDEQLNEKNKELAKKGEIDFEGNERISSAEAEIGVYEIDYNNIQMTVDKEMNKDNTPNNLEFYSPTGFTEGYYREFTGTAFVRNSNTDRGQWVNIEAFEPISFHIGQPKDFTLRLRRSLRGESRIPFRDGEKIIAIETADKKPIEARRDRRTGNYVIRGFSSDVRIYYDVDQEQKHRIVPPVETEKIAPLNFKKLHKKWQTLIAVLRADKSLSLQQKAAIVITTWGRNFTYSDRKGLKINEQTEGDSVEEIGTKILNAQIGDCDIASSGCIFLLRAVGIPARMPVGKMLNNLGGGENHAWSEFWNGNKWISFEPQVGVKSDPVILAAKARAQRDANKKGNARGAEEKYELVFEPTLSDADDLLADNQKIIDKFNSENYKIADEDILLGNSQDGSISSKEIGVEAGKGLGYGLIGAFLARFFTRKSEAKKNVKNDETKQDV